MTFAQIPIGAQFQCQGDTYTKIAVSAAREHTTRVAQIFHDDSFYELNLINRKRPRPVRSAVAFSGPKPWLP